MMRMRVLSVVVGGFTILLLAVGVAGAGPLGRPASPDDAGAVVASGISYQGRLTSPGGAPLDGTYPMRFIVYDDEVAGTALWDSGELNVAVQTGLFTVALGVDQADFDGQALWLSIIVDGETLSPRQEILPAPYALGLRPGADVVGDGIGATDAVLAGYAPATGTALFADANHGAGIFANSQNNYGVWGSSNDSWGGYFTSDGGYGIRVRTVGGEHWDHGAYVTAVSGYGVYAQSAQNQGVRGEAGDVTGVTPPTGPVGVVGIGTSRGTYGRSANGSGIYGISDANYGVWGQSDTYRGVTGRTDRADNNFGLYTPDNLYSLNVSLAGAVMQVMQNGGTEPLSPGDVVVFSGINTAVAAVEGPVVQVSKTNVANSTAVAGVVFSRFNMDAVDPALEAPDDSGGGALADVDVTPAGSASPGEFMLVVVQGPAQVKASAVSSGGIQPGDLLSTAGGAGRASKAATLTANGLETAIPGTVLGKALQPLDGTEDMIYMYVTLQ